jgi:hypothetical protein
MIQEEAARNISNPRKLSCISDDSTGMTFIDFDEGDREHSVNKFAQNSNNNLFKLAG